MACEDNVKYSMCKQWKSEGLENCNSHVIEEVCSPVTFVFNESREIRKEAPTRAEYDTQDDTQTTPIGDQVPTDH